MVSGGPVKVLHVIPGLGVGGAEGMLTALVTAERPERPDQVVVDLLAAEPSPNRDRLAAAGVPVHSLGMTRAAHLPRTVRRLAGLIRSEAPDVVQTWMYHADLIGTLAMRRSGRRPQTKLYWGVRCSDVDMSRYGLRLRLTVAACRRLSAQPDAVVANSETGRRVHESLGYRARRFGVIANGVDVDRFRPDPGAGKAVRAKLGIADGSPVIAMAARLDPMKDHATFLAALDLMPEVTGIAAGQDTQALQPRQNLKAVGVCRDMPTLLAGADLVVSCSAFGEGFPNVVAEAMACGTRVVATTVGDSGDIVGDTGLLVPPRDPRRLADAVRRLLGESPARRSVRSRAARERVVETYSLQRAVAAFDRLYTTGAL